MVELLVATSLLTIVLTATLRPLNAYERTASQNRAQNEAQGRARVTLDRLARELRNVAGQTQFIEKATATDLVYQTVDPTDGAERDEQHQPPSACATASTAPTQRVWRQTQTWTTSSPPAVPSTTSCPDSAWTTQAVTADQVTNGSRAVFTYNDNTDLTNITLIHTDIYIDVNPTLRPPESLLSSGSYLRNQNKAPIAAFTGDAHRQQAHDRSTAPPPPTRRAARSRSSGSTDRRRSARARRATASRSARVTARSCSRSRTRPASPTRATQTVKVK